MRPEIEIARYGVGHYMLDVLERLRASERDGCRWVLASNNLAGDPCPGIRKRLFVGWTDGHTVECNEGDFCDLMIRSVATSTTESEMIGVSTVTNESGVCCTRLSNKVRKRLLIPILSCQRNLHKRLGCRTTWMTGLSRYRDIEAFFVIGNAEVSRPELRGDVLELPCPDDYSSLPQKVHSMLQWCLERREFDYLFKCDDDTYVVVDRLAAYPLAGQDYIGDNLGGFAAGGSGYILSCTAAEIACARLGPHQHGCEDRIIGAQVRSKGVRLIHDGRFRNDTRLLPHVDNEQITCHHASGQVMEQIFQALRVGQSPINTQEFFEIVGWCSGYGGLGLGGRRGFTVDGSERVSFRALELDPSEYETISLHADSYLHIRCTTPIIAFGFLDLAASNRPNAPVEFAVDKQPLGKLHAGGQRTQNVTLDPGMHLLTARCSGQLAARYSVWAVRPVPFNENIA